MPRKSYATKHYGHGRWPQNQLVAIVASYVRKDWTAAEIAAKLGISEGQAAAIKGHVEWQAGRGAGADGAPERTAGR